MTGTKKKSTTQKKKPSGTKKGAKKTAVAAKSRKATPLDITAEERWRMVAVAAYHKSEKHGFAPGREMEDWLEAEHEIDRLLGRR